MSAYSIRLAAETDAGKDLSENSNKHRHAVPIVPSCLSGAHNKHTVLMYNGNEKYRCKGLEYQDYVFLKFTLEALSCVDENGFKSGHLMFVKRDLGRIG
jgi:hypothetical protein